MAAVGAIVGPMLWLWILFFTAILGGITAVIVVISKGRVHRTFQNLFMILMSIRYGQAPYATNPELDVSTDRGIRLPHGVIIAMGATGFPGRKDHLALDLFSHSRGIPNVGHKIADDLVVKTLLRTDAVASMDWSLSLQVFCYLQVLDVLTTWLGFRIGLSEASPFIRVLMGLGPMTAVLGSKVVALGLGALCVWSCRLHVIRQNNYSYAGLVIWNQALINLTR